MCADRPADGNTRASEQSEKFWSSRAVRREAHQGRTPDASSDPKILPPHIIRVRDLITRGKCSTARPYRIDAHADELLVGQATILATVTAMPFTPGGRAERTARAIASLAPEATGFRYG